MAEDAAHKDTGGDDKHGQRQASNRQGFGLVVNIDNCRRHCN